MIDYRMYSGGIPAADFTNNTTKNETNAVTLIKNKLAEEEPDLTVNYLEFVGFEGDVGTEFTLNKSTNGSTMVIPSTGKFVTPYNGTSYMPIYELHFTNAFSGNIYYIV